MAQEYQLGDFTLDQTQYRLVRGDRLLRLEKRPMELLILLIERRGELVTRDDIAERLWGKDIFVDVDHGINTAVRKLRQALRDDPDKPRFVETVVGKGYRFAATVISKNGSSGSQAEAPPPTVQVAPEPIVQAAKPKQVSTRVWVPVSAAIVVVLLAIGAVLHWTGSDETAARPAIKSLAVLPFKNLSGDPNQEHLADAMTEELIGRLSGIHDLRVTSRTSVMGLKDTKLSVPEIANKLRVDAVVEGSVIRDGTRIRVHAQLIRSSTDEHFWSEEYDRDLSDVLALQSEVAQAVAEKVRATLTGQERSRLTVARRVSPEVYESYLKGRFVQYKAKGDTERSIAYREEAIRKDPTFAPAYVGLAYAWEELSSPAGGYGPSDVRPKAISYAREALALDPALPDAHVLLAFAYQGQFDWNDAEREFKRALELSPNDAWTYVGYARWLLCQGRLEEAQEWALRGRELDPLTVGGHEIGWILFQSRRYDEAIRELRSDLAAFPDHLGSMWFLGYALIAKGRADEAIPVLEKAAGPDRNGAILGVLAHAYADAGRRPEALRVVDELRRQQQNRYVPAAAFVNAYVGLLDNEQAFAWLERAYQEQSGIVQYLKVHPFLDPLRSDPRFQDLLRRVGLDQTR